MEKLLNIHQRLSHIMQDAQSIEKKGWNDFSKYEYVRAVDVVFAMRILMIKHGVSFCITEESLNRQRIEKEKGGFQYMSEVCRVARFFNVDDPKDFLEIKTFAVAADSLDKDIYKAKTNALKYILTETFLIDSDSLKDAEDDDPKQRTQTPPPRQSQPPRPPAKPATQTPPSKPLPPKQNPPNQQQSGSSGPLGAFVITSGKYSGKKIKDIPMKDLKEYVDFLCGLEKKNKATDELIKIATEYILSESK